jgi:ubiquinone/menaquinone biosynthesis C-methylase UbiE/effector-binding domain-containing protein
MTRTLRAVCFSIVLATAAVCMAQSKTLDRDEVKKLIDQCRKTWNGYDTAANRIRVVGRKLNAADFKAIEWYEDQASYLKSVQSTLEHIVTRKRFSITTDERRVIDDIRRIVKKPGSAPRFSRFAKSPKRAPVKVRAKKKRPKKAAKVLSKREKAVKEIYAQKKRIIVELAAVEAREQELAAEAKLLSIHIEQRHLEKQLAKLEQEVEKLEQSKTPEEQRMKLQLQVLELSQKLTANRAQGLKAELKLLTCRVQTMYAQASWDKYLKAHEVKAEITDINTADKKKAYWLAVKKKTISPDQIEASHKKLFAWCKANKLAVKGPVVHLYPGYFLGHGKDMKRLGVGVVLAGKPKTIEDSDFSIENVEASRALSCHIKGPYEKTLSFLPQVLRVLKGSHRKPLGPIVVYYHSDPEQVDRANLHSEISIPLAKSSRDKD